VVEKVTSKVRDPERTKERERFTDGDEMVRACLLESLDTKIARQVMKLGSSRLIWDRLLQYNEQESASNNALLQRDFFELRMKPDEAAADYISRAEYLAGRLDDV